MTDGLRGSGNFLCSSLQLKTKCTIVPTLYVILCLHVILCLKMYIAFSVKHYTNYLMNNLLPFSQAANHASSPKKWSLVASGAAALATHFCRVPFGLAMNCPYSL